MTAYVELEKEARLVKMLGVGEPGFGKTGSLCSVMNTGRYKWRVMDFDGHFVQATAPFLTDVGKANVDVWRCEDKNKMVGPTAVGVKTGTYSPTVIHRAYGMLEHWKYKDERGREVDLGKPADWGQDTVIVVDSLSPVNRASMALALHVKGHTESGATRKDWQPAMALEEGFIENLTSSIFVPCHIVVFSHLRMIGPEELPDDIKGEDPDVRAAKKDLVIRRNEQLEWRDVPRALGKDLSRNIAEHFPIMVLYDKEIRGTTVHRIVRFQASEKMAVKVPALNTPASMPAETGLRWLFSAVEGGWPDTGVTA